MPILDDGSHASDDLLERYAMAKASEVESASVEEHLIACGHCQERLAALDDFIHTFKQTAPVLEAQDQAKEQLRAEEGSLWQRLMSFVPMPAPAMAAACLAIVALVSIPMWRAGNVEGTPQTVELQAVRAAGTEDAEAGRPLVLRLNLEGLDLSTNIAAEVADADGDVILQQPLPQDRAAADVKIPKGLAAGRYWIRVYRQQAGEPGDPLREFGLTVR